MSIPRVHAWQMSGRNIESPWCDLQLQMPPAAMQALEQKGFLYLEQRSTATQYNISVRATCRVCGLRST